ncbi:MAG: response regulator transcription factor [Dehalococcoidales bacterium]|nr:response regulator transcription factor [Dehalococcoidales bacterium]
MEKIRILIADDHPVVREGLSSMLNKQPDFQVVGEAENGQDAIDQALKLKPDVVLLDLRMPVVDGVEAMRKIKEQDQDIKYVVLTTYDSDEYIFQGIEAGATAYLLKDSPREELFKAIRSVMQGESLIQPSIASKVLDRFVKISREIREPSGFSNREIEVMGLMAKGLSNKDIADSLFLSESTVKTHIQNIFHRLKVKDRTEAVMVAIKKGLIAP